MVDFATLKKNRGSKRLDDLNKKLTDMNKGGFQDPDREKYWNITRDQAGNGSAIIRFLDAPEGEDEPSVKIRQFSFKGPTGQWYIENNRYTLKEADPVAEVVQRLYATGNESDKKKAQAHGGATRFISNIYVVKDSANPENEGKVFLFKYGKKIFDKINEQMNPTFEGEERVNPFDLWEGANFRMKVKTVADFPNYDSSTFDSPSPLADTDEEIEAIWKQCHSLQEQVSPEKFKSYDELKARYELVMGLKGNAGAVSKSANDSVIDEEESAPPREQKSSAPKAAPETSNDDDDEDGDADMEFYKKLLAQ